MTKLLAVFGILFMVALVVAFWYVIGSSDRWQRSLLLDSSILHRTLMETLDPEDHKLLRKFP